MNHNKKKYKSHGGHGTYAMMVLCLLAVCMVLPAHAQKNGRKGDEKVYLDHADELKFDQYAMPGIQVLKGNVRFRYQDTQLSCDSAHFNQEKNTFRAFGHVRMKKAGGITLTCQRARYDGRMELVQARQNVVLSQPGRTLTCDSLDYNTNINFARYFGGNGGRLVSGKNSVVSMKGEYYMNSHQAYFHDDVVMKSEKYTIETDNLQYNTHTEEAHVTGPSVIKGKNGEVVHTNDGYYYAKTDRMELTGRSTMTSKERDVEGDNLTYSTVTGESEGHGNVKVVDKVGNRTVTGEHLKYNEKTRKGFGEGKVVYVDMKNKNSLIAEYVNYTDSAAIAYGEPLMKEFSEKDTLYVRSDTIRMKSFFLNTDSVYREAYCYNNVRAYRRDVQAVCGLLVLNSKDSCLTMKLDPIVWSDNRQLTGDSIRAYLNDSTVREAYVYGNAMSIETVNDGKHYNQVAAKEMRAFFENGKMRRSEAIGNVLSVYFPEEEKDSSLIGLNYLETDTLRMYLTPERKLQKIWVSKPVGTLYPMTQIPPGKEKLPAFAWYDYVRPIDQYDLRRRVGKGDNKPLERRVVLNRPPRQLIGSPQQQTKPKATDE